MNSLKVKKQYNSGSSNGYIETKKYEINRISTFLN